MAAVCLVALWLTASLFLPIGMNMAARRNSPPNLPEGGTR